jgi:hypothetical protein
MYLLYRTVFCSRQESRVLLILQLHKIAGSIPDAAGSGKEQKQLDG